MERAALVLGASGGIGGAVARRLLESGWTVRALARADSLGRLPAGVEAMAGDAMDARAVRQAADGAVLVVHAVNPPGYRDWDRLVLPMLDNTVAAARANGARILLPGTVYNYGPDAFPLIGEDAPQNPATRKGRIRVEMERRLHEAAQSGEAPVLVVRAGDFFGPGAGNNWFAQGLVPAGRRPAAIRNPAARGVGHQWAYLPDVAETMVRLAETDGLGRFERFHMDGHWDSDGTRMPQAIADALGSPRVPVRPLPWWALRLAAPFNRTVRELLEMRYLWRQPVRLSNARLVARLGAEPRTPLREAVAATLAANRNLG
ncbi:NAD-dependent epimerase/dehydratase family protein [Aureimonas jatrophae]|uniref:Nucleoside-diphosphate-sugar epimerase n=1 Tax=Aureimonas jatrophae TaxID=1166073 RepID=A0A1H0HT39_9HYPH|nr:NAD-dependent epimerase/dehydratase family protein [Aureimonas jatrophae]MBB3950761.1 nucleoside-diphosphate-sugar epimerase [Aureimonas jatrophae]SDO22298.1 Nucleoside-diphosphate-sugar epimerase [Aureimonas jatrophae]